MSTPTKTELPSEALPATAELAGEANTTATTETVAAEEETHAEGGLAVLGIDTPFLIAQVVNFLLLLVLLRWLLYRPLLAMLNQRRTTIEESLKQAAVAKEAADNAAVETKKQLDAAREQAKQIVEDAKAQATLVATQLKEQASSEAEALLERTRTQLGQEKAAVLAEAEHELSSLVLAATQKVVAGQELSLSSSDVEAAITAVKGQS